MPKKALLVAHWRTIADELPENVYLLRQNSMWVTSRLHSTILRLLRKSLRRLLMQNTYQVILDVVFKMAICIEDVFVEISMLKSVRQGTGGQFVRFVTLGGKNVTHRLSLRHGSCHTTSLPGHTINQRHVTTLTNTCNYFDKYRYLL